MTPTADSPPALLREPPSALIEAACLNAEAAAAVSAFFHEGQSANTARTYKTALQYWGAWHALRYGRALSAPVAATSWCNSSSITSSTIRIARHRP